METTANRRAGFSIPAIIAVIAAIWSFIAGPAGGLVLAAVAIMFGVLGVIMSLSPNVRGGFISILSMMAGSVAIILALMKMLARLL